MAGSTSIGKTFFNIVIVIVIVIVVANIIGIDLRKRNICRNTPLWPPQNCKSAMIIDKLKTWKIQNFIPKYVLACWRFLTIVEEQI